MGRKRSSNDVDLVQPDQYVVPKNKKAKIPPPEPWPLPNFDPLVIDFPYTDGAPNLPHVDPTDPLALFKLIWTDGLLEELAAHTNEYARLHPYRKYKDKNRKVRTPRKWKPTSARELLTFLAVTIHMGLSPERDIEEYWTTTRKRGVDHFIVRENMGKNRWQQIDSKLHISFPKDPDDKTKESPFDKIATLSDTIRDRFRRYWKPGTHLAVDETIVRFTGRAFETVNIPSKPTPEGFKIWVVADQGYILDWLWHAKGDKKGPVDLDEYWTKDKGFSKTQAVVLDLLLQELDGKRYFHRNKHIVWLDNLFTSVKLLHQLREEGIGAAGTVRTTKTRREVVEEWDAKCMEPALRSKKDPPEQIDRSLADLKLVHSSQIEWGKLYGRLSEDRSVMEFAWKDADVVLFMSTVDSGKFTKNKALRVLTSYIAR